MGEFTDRVEALQRRYVRHHRALPGQKKRYFLVNAIIVFSVLFSTMYYLKNAGALSPTPVILSAGAGLFFAFIQAVRLSTMKQLEGQLMLLAAETGSQQLMNTWLQEQNTPMSGSKLRPHEFGAVCFAHILGWIGFLVSWYAWKPEGAILFDLLVAAIGLVAHLYNKSR